MKTNVVIRIMNEIKNVDRRDRRRRNPRWNANNYYQY
jgi:hypothetical protein